MVGPPSMMHTRAKQNDFSEYLLAGKDHIRELDTLCSPVAVHPMIALTPTDCINS